MSRRSAGTIRKPLAEVVFTGGRQKNMIKQTIATVFFSIVASFGLTVPAQAGVVVSPTFGASNQTAPPDTTDYEGIFYDGSSTFPPAGISIGTFNFTIPAGERVIGATISGTFGDVNIPVTALADLFVDNGTIEAGKCDIESDGVTYPPCAAGTVDGSLVPWSYTFSSTDLTNLATGFSHGSIDFTAVQNSPFGAVVVGDPTLDIQVSPEPASILTLAGGLLAFAAFRRRK
jgi:hypothetical protein